MKHLMYIISAIGLGLLPQYAFAAGLVPCGGVSDDHACTYKDIIPALNNIMTFGLTTIIMPILAILIVIAGFKILTARDDEAKYKEGLKMIQGVVWGFGFALLAWVVVRSIATFLKL